VGVNADIDTSKSIDVSGSFRWQEWRLKQKDEALMLLSFRVSLQEGYTARARAQTAELSLPEATQATTGAFSACGHYGWTVLLDKSVPPASDFDVVRGKWQLNVVRVFQSEQGPDRARDQAIDIKNEFQVGSFPLYPPHLYWLILII